MSFFNTIYRLRVPLSLVIGAVLVFAIWNLKNEVVHDWNGMMRDGKEYRHSPGCVPTETEIDASLTPCRTIMTQVVAKSRTTEHRRSRVYAGGIYINHNTLTLQDVNHQTKKLYEIRDSFWDVLAVGDTVQATVWKKGEITKLEAKGEHSTAMTNPDLLINNKIKTWAYTIMVCGVLLTIIQTISWFKRLF